MKKYYVECASLTCVYNLEGECMYSEDEIMLDSNGYCLLRRLSLES